MHQMLLGICLAYHLKGLLILLYYFRGQKVQKKGEEEKRKK
jgi:hypothetical protein